MIQWPMDWGLLVRVHEAVSRRQRNDSRLLGCCPTEKARTSKRKSPGGDLDSLRSPHRSIDVAMPLLALATASFFREKTKGQPVGFLVPAYNTRELESHLSSS
jgi:hypothetical protein